MKNKIINSITNGVTFLAKDQKKNGSFMCLVSEVFDEYQKAKSVPAIVPANIVLSSLIHLRETSVVKKVKDKVAHFLLTQKGDHWSFNYWFKGYREYRDIPYPDDLDDTFCALSALYEYDAKLFDGKVMGKIVTMLTSAEEAPGGPYNMWLVPKSAWKNWHDIDLVVNSNIAFFLSLQDIHLPKLDQFIERSIEENDYEFPYNTIYPGIYFISRFYNGKKASRMIKLILSKMEPDGKWENPLRTALAISALLNLSNGSLSHLLQDSIDYLLKTQSKDGSWKPYSFFFQMRLQDKTLYAGSSSITTALCLEAINTYQNKFSQKIDSMAKIEKEPKISEESIIYDAIKKRARKRFSHLGIDLRKQALRVLGDTLKGDIDGQIALLPLFFRKSIGSLGKSISDECVVRLGLGTLYGWMAYTIYDDFLDKEGDVALLSVANISLRESCRIFDSVLPDNTMFSEFSHKIFDTIDSANTWEVVHCRSRDTMPDYGDYGKLAERSLGHALGPLSILFKLGYKEDSQEVQNLLDFFRHYLIARQLNDDAHDWQEDLDHGRINAVVPHIFHDLGSRKYSHNRDLEQIFWDKTILRVCRDISHHLLCARKSLKKISVLKDTAILAGLLTSIDHAVEQTLNSHKETNAFLGAYAE
jgi:hypothetical protein